MTRFSLINIWNVRFLRFAGGGLLNLTLKITLTPFFRALDFNIWASYAIVHIIVLFFSFFYHSLITFKVMPDLKYFLRFTNSVLILKVLDYFLVTITNHAETIKMYIVKMPYGAEFLSQHFLTLTILCSTTMMFILRYLLFRKTFSKGDIPRPFTNGSI